jgi:hypothetical protein
MLLYLFSRSKFRKRRIQMIDDMYGNRKELGETEGRAGKE